MLNNELGSKDTLLLVKVNQGRDTEPQKADVMKIQSHDLSMQSQHVSYKSQIAQELSFSTFFTDPQDTQELDKTPDNTQVDDSAISTRFGHFYTLNSIIQNLFQMLAQRTQKNLEEAPVIGGSQLSFYEKYEEHEHLDFATSGEIKTDKGSFNINMNFSMSRSFVVENRIDVFSAFDPLVINLEGGIPDLSTTTFSFDLDNDGESDQISKLKAGNGFLALDKNEDGTINQGSELFGTLTGNGFSELSIYDEDNNSWIDESDSIFNKLQIWLKNEDSKDKELVGLGEVGIGAIFLGSQESEFTYKTEMNQTLGEMRSCGVFLSEDGKCGNISQIDLVSQESPLSELLQA